MFRSPRGTQDVLPDDAPYWRFVEEEARRQAERFGYSELRTPTIEDTALFLRGVGAGTDIVEKEIYSFKDKGGNDLALRAEGTAPVVRAYLQHGMQQRPQPVKLYSLISAFRYDRPQAGRYREFHQFNCESIGDSDPLIDADVILLLWGYFERLGLSRLSLEINSIGDQTCRPSYRAKLSEYFSSRQTDLCQDCRRRLETNPLRVLDCKIAVCQPVIEAAPRTIDSLCTECAQHFEHVRDYLAVYGLSVNLNPRLVRGLDYYTRTVFEVWPAAIGAQAALGGGGRYDGLAEQLGGPPTPGIGFATGLERIILNLREQGIEPPLATPLRVFIVALGEPARRQAAHLAADLRVRDVSSTIGFGLDRGIRSQLRQANTLGAEWAAIIGDDEIASGTVTLRNLKQQQEVKLPFAEAIDRISAPPVLSTAP